jgi:hypothetical protein
MKIVKAEINLISEQKQPIMILLFLSNKSLSEAKKNMLLFFKVYTFLSQHNRY